MHSIISHPVDPYHITTLSKLNIMSINFVWSQLVVFKYLFNYIYHKSSVFFFCCLFHKHFYVLLNAAEEVQFSLWDSPLENAFQTKPTSTYDAAGKIESTRGAHIQNPKKYKNIDSQSHTIWVGENAHKFCIFFFYLNPKHKFVYSSKRT